MRVFKSVLFCFLLILNSYAADDEVKIAKPVTNEDKLDVLDQQSKEFFNAITGLEKDYLEEQLTKIEEENKKKVEEQVKKRREQNPNYSTTVGGIVQRAKVISQEEIERNIFRHQNEMAQLTSNFAKSKQLKDIQIKSMYKFNGKDYVVLKLSNERASNKQNRELSSSIEGRYKRGDYILGHRISAINSRTKSMTLYKKLDDEFGYNIYLSNYGISVSNLIKLKEQKEKQEEKKRVKKEKKERRIKQEAQKEIKSVSKAFKKVEIKKDTYKTDLDTCLYTVIIGNLNVRVRPSLDARILRVLKRDDQFTVVRKVRDWVQLHTIYKKVSRDVMPVEKNSNWLQIIDNNVIASDKNCLQ